MKRMLLIVGLGIVLGLSACGADDSNQDSAALDGDGGSEHASVDIGPSLDAGDGGTGAGQAGDANVNDSLSVDGGEANPENDIDLQAGSYGCVLEMEMIRNGQIPTNGISTISVGVEVTSVTRSELTVAPANENDLGLDRCAITWVIDDSTGTISSQDCDYPEASWQEGSITQHEDGFEMVLYKKRDRDGAVFESRNRFDCTPRSQVENVEFTLIVDSTEARVFFGPEPDLTEGYDVCFPRIPCVVSIPLGWWVRVTSSFNTGPPSIAMEPQIENTCVVDPINVVQCDFLIDSDLSLTLDWPVGFTRTLTVRANGISTAVSYPYDGKTKTGSCTSECDFEVDSRGSVGVSVFDTDVDLDISGQRYSCQITGGRWSCNFDMDRNRTFVVTPKE
jgi:hypothetical protein